MAAQPMSEREEIEGAVVTGPYIVTTKRQGRREAGWSGWTPWEVLSRRAIATLDEARLAARQVVVDWTGEATGRQLLEAFDAATAIESGTITLPDGTVIEVEAKDWYWLAVEAGLSRFERWQVACDAERGNGAAQQCILDAYNARQ